MSVSINLMDSSNKTERTIKLCSFLDTNMDMTLSKSTGKSSVTVDVQQS